MSYCIYKTKKEIIVCMSIFIPGAPYTHFSYSVLVFLSIRGNLVAIVYRKTIANNIRDCCYGKLKMESLV